MKPIRKKYTSKYKVNHNIFQEENEASFYLAGFIAADGCIRISKTNKNRNYINHRLQISLSKDDKEHLVKIRELLGSTNPINDYEIKNSKKNPNWNDVWESKLLITSKQIVNDLKKFNIVPRKSLTYKFPSWLKKHPLRKHFMRGYFDGDGSFYFNKELSYNRLCFSLRGTKEFLKVYQRVLERDCNFKSEAHVSKTEKIGHLRYKGKFATQIKNYFYNNSKIYLTRKRKIGDSI